MLPMSPERGGRPGVRALDGIPWWLVDDKEDARDLMKQGPDAR